MKTFVTPCVEMRNFDVEDALTTSAVESGELGPTLGPAPIPIAADAESCIWD
ncbi:MAG: hypothetical protein LBM28_04055 [Oscillospiraceae bacterium]|jgi:hypothetical protein|nr:hypothetical protein [Oscillospiraceae bacterium]